MSFFGESQSTKQKRIDLNNQGAAAAVLSDAASGGYQQLGNEASANRARLDDQATGRVSLSGEQLRQGLQQNMSAQRSMAASASPANAAMAARTAAIQGGRMGMGMSGQAATAGIQERRSAQDAINNSLMQQRQQDANVALGSRQNAISGYGGTTPEGTGLEKATPVINAGIGALGAIVSDRRTKTDIESGDERSRRILEGLKAYSYRYKDQNDGAGRQLGVMAQDLEKAGLKQAVIDSPSGKQLDAGKLAGANTALLSALARRVDKLETPKGGLNEAMLGEALRKRGGR
jgi:hypothetical protein